MQAFEAAGLQSYEWERFCREWKGEVAATCLTYPRRYGLRLLDALS